MSTVPKHEPVQPGDLAAYKALLLAIAAEAVQQSQQPMGESHREVKVMTVKQLNDEAEKNMKLAQGLRP